MNTYLNTLPEAGKNEVFHVAENVLAATGTVTTLEVKDILRKSGYWAKQAFVSHYMEVWANDTGRCWNDANAPQADGTWTTHRVYRDYDTPGQKPAAIHQDAMIDPQPAKPSGRSLTVGGATITFTAKS